MDNDRNSASVGFLSGMVIGAFAGAVIALMLAPQTGEETRELILGKAQEAKGKALDLASDLRDLASQLAEDLRKQADELAKKSRSAYEQVAKRADSAVQTGREAAKAKLDELRRD